MFDAVRNNKKIIQIILALIILPFAFWGVESYIRNVGSVDYIAKVGSSKISPQEFQRALHEQQEAVRNKLGDQVDSATLESPALKRAVLDNLINRKMLLLHLTNSNLTANDEQVARLIGSMQALQVDGKFSPQRYEQALANMGKSKAGFEADIRQDLLVQQAVMAVGDGSMPGDTARTAWLKAMFEKRDFSEAVLSAEQYLGKVRISPDALKTYYESNSKKFEVAEQLRAEYVVLDLSDERRASHILIRVAKDAPEDQVAAAKAKAEQLLAQLRKTPGDFAKLAKQVSEDPGSKANGGDLDWFGRGMMTRSFEDAAFSIREGLVDAPVRSEFGFHIVKVTGARPDRPASNQTPAEMADAFVNLVYEQPDSLKPAAEKFNVPVQQSGWIAKGGAAPSPLGNAKVMKALFSDDVTKNGRNTEAIEVAPGVFVAARVLEHKPALAQPLEVVAPTIEKMLAHQEAAKLAAKDGQDKLALLAKGDKVALAFGQEHSVMRMQSGDLPPEALRAIFRADAGKLPVYVGVEAPAGYVIFRISRVVPYTDGAVPDEALQALRNQYARAVGEEELAAWLTALKDRYPVTINEQAIGGKAEK